MTLPGCRTHSILVECQQWPQTSTWRWTASLTSTGAGAERTMTLLPGKEGGDVHILHGDNTKLHVDMWDVHGGLASEIHAQLFHLLRFLYLLCLTHSVVSHVYSLCTTCFPFLWLFFMCPNIVFHLHVPSHCCGFAVCLLEWAQWVCLHGLAHRFGLGCIL